MILCRRTAHAQWPSIPASRSFLVASAPAPSESLISPVPNCWRNTCMCNKPILHEHAIYVTYNLDNSAEKQTELFNLKKPFCVDLDLCIGSFNAERGSSYSSLASSSRFVPMLTGIWNCSQFFPHLPRSQFQLYCVLLVMLSVFALKELLILWQKKSQTSETFFHMFMGAFKYNFC